MVSAEAKLARLMLEYDEGRRPRMYKDTVGKWTIGVGWNLSDNGLPPHIIDALLEHGIQTAAVDLDAVVPSWRTADPIRRAALLNWAFQLGRARMLSFQRTIPLLQQQRWEDAARNLRMSKWARTDSPARAARIIGQIRTGQVDTTYPARVGFAAATLAHTAAVDA